MSHVTDKLPAWLAGELDVDDERRVARHLASCAACRDAADEARDLWETLGRCDPPPSDASAWPAIREVTFGRPRTGWFFGSGSLVRAGLAAGALTAGLVIGVVAPGVGARAGDDDGTLAGLWLEGTALYEDSTSEDLAGAWLDAAWSAEDSGS